MAQLENKKSDFTIPLNAAYLKILILLNGLRRFEPEAPGRRFSKWDSQELIEGCFLETGYGSNVSGNCHKLSFSSFISLHLINTSIKRINRHSMEYYNRIRKLNVKYHLQVCVQIKISSLKLDLN